MRGRRPAWTGSPSSPRMGSVRRRTHATPGHHVLGASGSCSSTRTASPRRTCSTPISLRLPRRMSARWRARSCRRPARGPWRRATGRLGTSSARRPTSPTRTGRAPPPPTCSCDAPRSRPSVASPRACARPRTRTSAGACRRRAGGCSRAPPRAWSTPTGEASASCAGSGAATPPGAHGSPGATRGSFPSPRWRGRCGGSGAGREEGSGLPPSPPDPHPSSLAHPRAEPRAGSRGEPASRSTRCLPPRSWLG